MILTLGEVLENAEYNLANPFNPIQLDLGRQQLSNYKALRDKGYSDDDDFNEIMSGYDSVEEVPSK